MSRKFARKLGSDAPIGPFCPEERRFAAVNAVKRRRIGFPEWEKHRCTVAHAIPDVRMGVIFERFGRDGACRGLVVVPTASESVPDGLRTVSVHLNDTLATHGTPENAA
jgi:hypothetical protein